VIAAVRRLLRRQKIRAHIRREQEEFLREHPELRLPKDRSQSGTTDRTGKTDG
jgi:hypothetical protein